MPHGIAARSATFFVVVLLLALPACVGEAGPGAVAGSSPARASVATDSYPVTIASGDGDITIEARPERIVSLSATATEMLFAIGAGEQVEAVDDQSDYPPEAPTTNLSGYEPNVEAILGYAPDLVVTAGDPGDLGRALEAAEVPLLVHPAATDLEDAYAQIEDLGLATGHEGQAQTVTEGMRAGIDAAVEDADATTPPPTIYHELDDTYYSVTSATFIGQLYELAGLTNIADDAKNAAGDYPQLSSEFIVEADPDLIFLADTECCGQTPAKVAHRPGWSSISAVRTGSVIPLDDDIASRWGPRVVDFLEQIVAAASDDRVAA